MFPCHPQILYRLYRSGLGRAAYQRPSTTFIVGLFNQLQRGAKVKVGSRRETVTDTIRSFSGQVSRPSRGGQPVLRYKIPTLPEHETLSNAEIRFLRRSVDAWNIPDTYALKVNVRKNRKLVHKFVIRDHAPSSHGYDVFDVTNHIHPWINLFHGNVTLYIRVMRHQHNVTSNMESLIALYLEDKEFLNTLGLTHLVGSTAPAPVNVRPRRDAHPWALPQPPVSPGKWRRNGKRKPCQLYDFEVDFDAIGWGQWIVHPKKFNSRFCFGLCQPPLDAQYQPSNHAVLKSLMRLRRPSSAPASCCVASKLRPMSMLYFELNEIVVRHHEDMIAHQCGCT
ncbi:growth/differentiation factor 2-like [Physella acuta]|uniref:growth/differentiation factor 2-like n=1 Tax=Physella acuta TaxID=109671 RepID=UPI0027DC008B|nr:growth/differentiation factor 2-like [Physella acuta]